MRSRDLRPLPLHAQWLLRSCSHRLAGIRVTLKPDPPPAMPALPPPPEFVVREREDGRKLAHGELTRGRTRQARQDPASQRSWHPEHVPRYGTVFYTVSLEIALFRMDPVFASFFSSTPQDAHPVFMYSLLVSRALLGIVNVYASIDGSLETTRMQTL